MIIKDHQILRCPHCDEEQDGPAEEYVVHGRMGTASAVKDRCIHCDKLYIAERVSETEIKVEVAE